MSFAGTKAKTADNNQLSTAQHRLAEGGHAEVVRRDTGWHIGVDGEWRFEIDDSKAQWHPGITQAGLKVITAIVFGNIENLSNPRPFMVEELLVHPELFAAYPDIGKIKLAPVNDGSEWGVSSFEDNTYFIATAGGLRNDESVLLTIQHEIQHTIQEIEGFASGGSPFDKALPSGRDLAEKKNETYRKAIKDIESSNEYNQFIGDFIASYPEDARYSERRGNKYDKAKYDAESAAFTKFIEPLDNQRRTEVDTVLGDDRLFLGLKGAAYKRLAGEVEARNTEARRSLTMEQRKATPPSKTQDLPDSDVIVSINNKVVAPFDVINYKVRVVDLQRQLADTEKEFDRFKGKNAEKWEGEEWQDVSKRAGAIRVQLFDLTGDYYGKSKIKQVKLSDEALNADYDFPWDVPKEVMSWVQRNSSLLTSDATDAVRWSRIVDTLKEDRYPSGDITLYRSVDGDDIRPGDWVTTDRSYAEEHLSKYLNGNGQILEETVDGRDVLVSPTGNDEEAIYAPREYSGPVKINHASKSVNASAKALIGGEGMAALKDIAVYTSQAAESCRELEVD